MKTNIHQKTIISFALSALLLSPVFAFDFGKVLSDAVNKSVNDAIEDVAGDTQQKINKLLHTAIPKLGDNAKHDDGKYVNLKKGVYIFGHNGCPPSRKAFAYFKRNKIPYTLMDVRKDAKAARVAQQQGIVGVPTIFVNGERIVGYSPNNYETLLKKHGKMK